MERESFQRTLNPFVNRRPLKPFSICFVDGSSITVEHPETLVIRNRVAMYFDQAGESTLFDHESVSQLSTTADAVTAQAS